MKVEKLISGNTLPEIAASAQEAEAMGYDGVLVREGSHDAFLPLLIAGYETKKITLATSVAIAFPRSPMITATIAWDLQRYTNGRFILGLGTQVKGQIEQRYSTPWVAPGPRLREYIQSLRAIWDCWQNGSKLNFCGKHYTFTLMTPTFNPGPLEHPHIPIHIGSLNPYNARLAGELADGFRMHPLNSRKWIEEVLLPNIEAGAKKAGRSLKDIDICNDGFILTGETWADVERQKEVARRTISFYASTRTYKGVLDVHGWGDTCLKLHELSLRGKWDEMVKEVTDEMLEAFAVMGTYDEIVDKIKERYGGIVTRLGLSVPVRDERDKGRLREIIQALKAE